VPSDIKNPEILMVVDELQKLNTDEKMRRRMEDREQAALDLAIYRGYAFREGREEGKIEGRAEGLLEGEAKGKAEGKAEEKEAVAMRLHKLGLSTAMIAEATGLSEEQLTKLLLS